MQTVIIKIRQEKMVTRSAKRVTKTSINCRTIITKLLQKCKHKFCGILAFASLLALIGIPNAMDFGRITFGQAILSSVLSLVAFVVFAGLGGAFNNKEE